MQTSACFCGKLKISILKIKKDTEQSWLKSTVSMEAHGNLLLLVPIHLAGMWLGYDNSDLNLHSCRYIFLATYQFPVDFWCRRGHLFHKFLLENCKWFRFRVDRGEREVVPVPFHQSCTRRGARCMCKNECTERCTGKTSACCNSNPFCCPWLRLWKVDCLMKINNYERWQILSSVNKC